MGILGGAVLAAAAQLNGRGLYLGRRSSKAHVALYRWSNGRIGGHITGWPEARILLLDHVGARSRIHRTSPVIFVADGSSIAVAASKAGQAANPAWYHNLRADPETTIRIGSEMRAVRARIADDAERQRLWSAFVGVFPAFEQYEQQAGTRQIPVVVLDPR